MDHHFSSYYITLERLVCANIDDDIMKKLKNHFASVCSIFQLIILYFLLCLGCKYLFEISKCGLERRVERERELEKII